MCKNTHANQLKQSRPLQVIHYNCKMKNGVIWKSEIEKKKERESTMRWLNIYIHTSEIILNSETIVDYRINHVGNPPNFFIFFFFFFGNNKKYSISSVFLAFFIYFDPHMIDTA